MSWIYYFVCDITMTAFDMRLTPNFRITAATYSGVRPSLTWLANKRVTDKHNYTDKRTTDKHKRTNEPRANIQRTLWGDSLLRYYKGENGHSIFLNLLSSMKIQNFEIAYLDNMWIEFVSLQLSVLHIVTSLCCY